MSGPRPNTFKVVQLNAENLFLFFDGDVERDWRRLSEKEWQSLSHASVPNKSLSKTLWLADSLLDIDADVICLNEVGGQESLENFNRYFLGDRYIPHLIEGNSNRGIDVGYLVRRELDLRTELRSHKERPLHFLYPHERDLPEKAGKTHYFSRDCAELRLYHPHETGRPRLVLLLVHLKSKLDPNGIDPQGVGRRRAELKTLVHIYKEVREEFTPAVPVIICGDFNGCARRDQMTEEFADLAATDLETVVEALGRDGDEVATQIQFARNGNVQCLQIDFIFISPELKSHLLPDQFEVFRYRSELKVALPLPETYDQRLRLPSDHYPVVAAFSADALLAPAEHPRVQR